MDIRTVTGPELVPFIPAIARLRIAVFRAFPYLYEGSEAYERDYLATYASSPQCCAVLAFDGEEVVGASTALPLAHETQEVKAPFEAVGMEIDSIFYLAESVLLERYRGQGIGVRFFAEREQAARAAGASHTAFCAVVRPEDHPLRPAGYVPLDDFWRKRGYQPVPGLTTAFHWPDLGESENSAKTMQFWMKALD